MVPGGQPWASRMRNPPGGRHFCRHARCGLAAGPMGMLVISDGTIVRNSNPSSAPSQARCRYGGDALPERGTCTASARRFTAASTAGQNTAGAPPAAQLPSHDGVRWSSYGPSQKVSVFCDPELRSPSVDSGSRCGLEEGSSGVHKLKITVDIGVIPRRAQVPTGPWVRERGRWVER